MFSQPHSHYLSYCRCGISRKSAGVLCGAGAFRSVVAGALLLFSLVLLVPHCAFAATWPVAGHRPSPSLGFHETYTAGISENRSYVHSGIDAPGSAGSQIVSPIAGTVCFTGSVPSGDSAANGGGAGQTMLGVSVKLADGRTVTLMPFEDVTVENGDSVEEGTVLGTLAPSGDRSSAATHLHMGLKRGSTYYDPMALFGLAQEPNSDANTAQEPVAVKTKKKTANAKPETATVPSAQTDSAAVPVADPSAQRAPQEQGTFAEDFGYLPLGAFNAVGETSGQSDASQRDVSTSKDDAGSAVRESGSEPAFGAISSGHVSWSPAGNAADQPLAPLFAGVQDLWGACLEQGASLSGSLFGEQAVLSPAGLAVGAAAVLLALLAFLARWVVARRRGATGFCGKAVSHSGNYGAAMALLHQVKNVLVRSGTG